MKAIGDMHTAHRAEATPLEHRLEGAVTMAANPAVLIVISILIVTWLAANAAADRLGFRPFDPFPYNLLQGDKAEVALIVSHAMPKDVETFDLVDGVWVTDVRCALPVAIAVRHSLIELARARKSVKGQQSKMELVRQFPDPEKTAKKVLRKRARQFNDGTGIW